MKRLFLLLFVLAGSAQAAQPFENVRRGDVVLFFGSPVGVFPETSPFSDRGLMVTRHFYLVHPLALRLDRPASRDVASEDSIESWPVYRLTRRTFLTEGAFAAPVAPVGAPDEEY